MSQSPPYDRRTAAAAGRLNEPTGAAPADSTPASPPSVPAAITPDEALASLPGAPTASPDGLVVLDAAWRPLYANAAAHALLAPVDGGEGDETVTSFLRLFARRERPAIAACLAAVRDGTVGAGGDARSGGWSSLVADAIGVERAIESVPHPVIDGGTAAVSVDLRDVTEERRLARRSTTLARLAARMAYVGSLGETLTQLARDVARATGLVDCSILLVDDQQGCEIIGLYGGDDDLDRSLLHGWQSGRLPLPPSLRAARERRPVVMHDVRRTILLDPSFAAVHEPYGATPWDTTVSVPLLFRDRVVGVLGAHYAPGKEPRDDDIAFLEVVAGHAAIAVENARLAVDARERAALAERRRADDALRASEGRFRALVEQSPFATQIFSADGRSLHVNAAYTALWGHTDEWLASTGFNVLDERNYREQDHRDPALLSPIRRAFAGETVALPLRFFDRTYFQAVPRAEGRWIRSSYYPVKDGAGAVREVINVFEDVTAQVEAEGRLREREEQYRGIFEATSDGLVITDRGNGVVDVNPAFCRMHGRTRDEIVGRHVSTFVHPSRLAATDEAVRAIEERGVYQAEGLNLRGDGSAFPVEVHATRFAYRGEPHVLGVVRDITEQVRAREMLERRVAERTRELSTLLEVSSHVASTLELRPLLGLILDELKAVIDHSGSSIQVVEGEWLHMLEHRFPSGHAPANEWMRAPLDDMLWWPTVRGGEPFVIDDVHADTPDAAAYRGLFAERWEAIRPYCRSYIAVPLAVKGRAIGALILSHSEPGYFTPERRAVALALASQAAVAIENARLYEQARRGAALEERQRLARELHDSVSQALYGIALGARTARALLDRIHPDSAADDRAAEVAPPLDYVLSLAEAALAEMRALIFELRPEALERTASGAG